MDQPSPQTQANAEIRTRSESAAPETFNLRDTAVEVIDQLQRILMGTEKCHGHFTRYSELDRMTRGLKPGDMFVIASRSPIERTSLLLNIVEHVCIDSAKPTLIVSSESTAFEIVRSIIYSRSGFEMSSLYYGYTPNKGSLLSIQHATHDVAHSKLFVDDSSDLTIDAFCSMARRQAIEHDIGLIAIDNIRLRRFLATESLEAREREIAVNSSAIKGLAKELGIPILVTAPLYRGPGCGCHATVAPNLSELCAYGAIEQDADVIGLLHRPFQDAGEAVDRRKKAECAELVIVRNLHGETGTIPMSFRPDVMRFDSHGHGDDEPRGQWC